MIDRYSRPKMKAVWSAENKFQKWLEVELAACEAHVDLGNLEQKDVIKEKASFKVERISEIEAEIHHDVIAFLTNLGKHRTRVTICSYGLNIFRCCGYSIQYLNQESGNILLESVRIYGCTKTQAEKYKYTLMMGRTHGVHAEPTTLGLN